MVILIIISIVIQTGATSLPPLMDPISRNKGFYFGLFIVMTVVILSKAFSSAVLIKLLCVAFNVSDRRISFKGSVAIALYCQMILLFGKVLAIIISLMQYAFGIADKFSVIRYPDVSILFAFLGWQIPELLGKADIFTILFISYLTQAIRSTADISQTTAVAAATANWLLIVLVQRWVIKMPLLIWG